MVLYDFHHLELFGKKTTKSFFVYSYVATMWFIVLNPLIGDVRLIASSSTLLYFDKGLSPESSRTRLFKPLLLNLNLSDLLP